MSEQQAERSTVLQGIASIFNFGGRVVVLGVEKGAKTMNGVVSVAKFVSRGPVKVADAAISGFRLGGDSVNKKIEEQIHEYEKKIKSRYYKIGKESAHSQNLDSTLQKESIQQLISDIREYEKEMQQLKEQIAVARASKRRAGAREPKKSSAKPSPVSINQSEADRHLRSIIEKAAKKGDFPSLSDRAVFHKVAEDLLDDDQEIRILAAAELGKMGNSAAILILMAVVRQDDAELAAEALNSLIALGDHKAVELFKEQASHPKYRVRMGCLRGIYKLALDDEAGPILIMALQDEHPEVRRSAATFLGWKDYIDAVPALAQCLRDEEPNVRKAAVSALTNLCDENAVLPLIRALGDQVLEIREKALEALRNITNESIVFDIHAAGSSLETAINDCIAWWQDKRSNKAASINASMMTEVTPAAEAVPEAEEKSIIPQDEESKTGTFAPVESIFVPE
ncbi:Magnetosome protein Mad23 [Desulfovibrionales bacterium]